MFKTFYVKPNERGILYNRSDFKAILEPGIHRYLGWNWRVTTYDLNQPEVQIEYLELLLQTERSKLEQHLTIVQTEFNRVALLQIGQTWITVEPKQLRAFWKGFIPVKVDYFNLSENIELPTALVEKTRGIALSGVQKFQVAESEIGLMYIQHNFVRPLGTGEYAFWTSSKDLQFKTLNRLDLNPTFTDQDVLIDRHPEFIAQYCTLAETLAQQVAIIRDRQQPIAILPPHSRKLFWQGVTVEIIDISNNPKLSAKLVAELVSGSSQIKYMSSDSLHTLEVPVQHLGFLYIDRVFQSQLEPGIHAWWTFN